MKKVILCVGPRASGKSSFCEKATDCDPDLLLISRDQLLIELYGSVHLNPYSGAHHAALQCMWERISSLINTHPSFVMILDCWNGSTRERLRIIRKLRDLGVDQVTAWYFLTPIEVVNQWFWEKPGIAKMSEMETRRGQGLSFFIEDAPRRDYELFHKLAATINTDGFDEVVTLNPLVTTPEFLLNRIPT